MTITRTILITGATAGIGRATALHLATQGHHVIASGRKPAELAKLREEAASAALTRRGLLRRAAADRAAGRETITQLRPRLDTIELDVTSATSIADAVTAVARLTGNRPLDVLVNNAGFGVLGPTIEISEEDMRRQYETNVFGLMNVVRAFVPQMRDAGAGRIVNISSIGGLVTIPYFGVYNSTKYAVESLSDALRYELQPLGIHVSLVEPGMIKTGFEATAVAGLGQFSRTAYARAVSHYAVISRQANRFAGEPIAVARAIERAVDARFPSARYVAPRLNYAAIWLARLMPQPVVDWALRTIGRLNKHTVTTATITDEPATAVTAPMTRFDAADVMPSGFELAGRSAN